MSGRPTPEALAIPEALRPFAARLLQEPDPWPELARMLRRFDGRVEAPALARAAVALRAAAPRDAVVARLTERLIRVEAPLWHFGLVNDGARNAAYAAGIAAGLPKGARVLEIGAGTGILSMLAVRAGAGHVWAVEVSGVMAEIARETVARNGMADRITVIHADAGELEVGDLLPAPCEALVQEIVSTDLLGEDACPLIDHARRRLLTPGAAMLPAVGIAAGALSGVAEARAGVRGGAWEGLDLSALDRVAPPAPVLRTPRPDARLSAVKPLHALDFGRDDLTASGRRVLRFEATADGVVEGVEQWLELEFPGGVRLSSGEGAGVWGARLHLFPEARAVRRGEVVEVAVDWSPSEIAVGLA